MSMYIFMSMVCVCLSVSAHTAVYVGVSSLLPPWTLEVKQACVPSAFTPRAVLLALVIPLCYHLYVHMYSSVLGIEPRASRVPVNPGTGPCPQPPTCCTQWRGYVLRSVPFNGFVGTSRSILKLRCSVTRQSVLSGALCDTWLWQEAFKSKCLA